MSKMMDEATDLARQIAKFLIEHKWTGVVALTDSLVTESGIAMGREGLALVSRFGQLVSAHAWRPHG